VNVTVAEMVLPAAGASMFWVNWAVDPAWPEAARVVPTGMAALSLEVTVVGVLQSFDIDQVTTAAPVAVVQTFEPVRAAECADAGAAAPTTTSATATNAVVSAATSFFIMVFGFSLGGKDFGGYATFGYAIVQ
jgi:hypothetical protein